MSFEQSLLEIYPWIFRVAKRYCSSTQDAEDLAGDTVYKILQNQDKFDCSKPMKPWCIAVMQNTYITRYNRSSLIHFTGYDSVEEKALDYTYESVLFNDLLSAISRCAQKTCCIDSVMYYAEGYSYDEISEILNIPIGTVRSRISFGRKKISQELDF